jgi:GNAT superfamily N-acetyltransferase
MTLPVRKSLSAPQTRSTMPETIVTISYLEMTSPANHRPKAAPRDDLAVARVSPPTPELNRFFYVNVGRAWHWFERLVWTDGDWLKYVSRPELETWRIDVADVAAGYFELERQGLDVEIVYFGLLPPFVEAGVGGWALSQAVEKAWAFAERRVWVHTCDLDHPRALTNYLGRGFRVYKTETKREKLPDRAPS